MSTWIGLPYGAKGEGFDAQDLVKHIAMSGRDYIIQGQQCERVLAPVSFA